MEIQDGTVTAPAAPHTSADLGVPAVDVNVAIAAYGQRGSRGDPAAAQVTLDTDPSRPATVFKAL
jgi:hypothetical protein